MQKTKQFLNVIKMEFYPESNLYRALIFWGGFEKFKKKPLFC